MAIELGVDLRTVSGSGPGGRIVERDVRAAADGAGGAAPVNLPGQVAVGQAPHPAAAGIGAAANAVSPEGSTALAVFRPPPSSLPAVPQPTDEYVDSPLSSIRKTIAARMTSAKRDVPHFYLTRDFEAAKLLGFRTRLNELLGDRGKVSVNDLMLKGVALALRRVPECNAAFMGDAIRYYTRVHLGVAVATERGLITPVVRNADLKGIGVIGTEVRDLVQRAKDRQLKTHEIQGSTFTVSNLGMFGIKHFEAIINPPEAGILALGTVRDEVVVRNGEIVAAKLMSLTMSCDHRVIDGALGARFVGALVDILEKPESLAL
jgi:pyruvate dehydrogenase E2 component (dihydrolipoamide acetyltransferase)